MKKALKKGFMTLRNEEMAVRGWAKTMLVFCDKVVAMIDPTTMDQTESILKSEFPEIEIQYQDRNLGDSDYEHQGPHKSFIMHNNQTKFVQEQIEDDEWFMFLGGDERIAFQDIPILLDDLKYAKKNGFECICHSRIHEPIPIHEENLKILKTSSVLQNLQVPSTSDVIYTHYASEFLRNILRHSRIQKKTPNWTKCPQPHSGYLGNYSPLVTYVPLWHFKRIRKEYLNSTCWSDVYKSYIHDNTPIMPIRVPFDDWRYGLEWTQNNKTNPSILELNKRIRAKIETEENDLHQTIINQQREELKQKELLKKEEELEINKKAYAVWRWQINNNIIDPETPFISPVPSIRKMFANENRKE